MEKVMDMSPTPTLKTAIPSEDTLVDQKTPPPSFQTHQNSPNSGDQSPKSGNPDRLKVPKAFNYPERYTSPTDLMISPVSKGLLARSRKSSAPLLPPSKNHLKDAQLQEVGLFQA